MYMYIGIYMLYIMCACAAFLFLHTRCTFAFVFLPKIFELFFFKAVPTPEFWGMAYGNARFSRHNEFIL